MKKKDILQYVLLCIVVDAYAVVACLDVALWIKLLSMICAFTLIAVTLLLKLKRVTKEAKLAKDNKQKTAPAGLTMLDIYAILKIAPQYNNDGTLKDVFQLLEIKPEYDANGKRILTIYEKLKLNPTFNNQGQEVPTVVVIKNKVNSLVKLKAAPIPLTYVSRDDLTYGKTPIVVPQPMTKEQPKEPQFKQMQVVKPAIKPAPKPAKKPDVKYAKSSKGIAITKPQIKHYKATEVGVGANTFMAMSEKIDSILNRKAGENVNKQKVVSPIKEDKIISRVTPVTKPKIIPKQKLPKTGKNVGDQEKNFDQISMC